MCYSCKSAVKCTFSALSALQLLLLVRRLRRGLRGRIRRTLFRHDSFVLFTKIKIVAGTYYLLLWWRLWKCRKWYCHYRGWKTPRRKNQAQTSACWLKNDRCAAHCFSQMLETAYGLQLPIVYTRATHRTIAQQKLHRSSITITYNHKTSQLFSILTILLLKNRTHYQDPHHTVQESWSVCPAYHTPPTTLHRSAHYQPDIFYNFQHKSIQNVHQNDCFVTILL